MRNPILINGRFLTRPMTGVERYAYELLKELNRRVELGLVPADLFQLALPAHAALPETLNRLSVGLQGRFSGMLWEHVELPSRAAGRLIVGLCSTGPFCYTNQAVAIHDATPVRFPNSFSLWFRLWYAWLMPRLGSVAASIITVTEFSKSELTQCYGIPTGKIRVVPASADHFEPLLACETAPSRADELADHPFLLVVGSSAAHKNLELLLSSVPDDLRTSLKIAMVGGVNERVFSGVDVDNRAHVVSLGRLSDAELVWLYRRACCLVFPSLYEGFGIPPLEAMYCGCPVVASRAAAIPEVCADAALYFDPHDSQAMWTHIRALLSDESMRSERVRLGLAQARQFSWARSADRLFSSLISLNEQRGLHA